MISAGLPDMPTAKRPRLDATASRIGSVTVTAALARFVAGSKLAGRLRDPELVHTNRNGETRVPGLDNVTRRIERAQVIVSCGRADESRNVATLPAAIGALVQLPAIGVIRA